jgi:DNA-binding CsgD family transcriptional regulator
VWTVLGAFAALDVHALLAAQQLDEAALVLATLRSVSTRPAPDEQRLNHIGGLLARAKNDLDTAELLHHRALAAQHAGGWRPDIVHSLEALAGIAVARESPTEAVRLAAAAHRLRAEMSFVLCWPFEHGLLEADLATARTSLGESAYDVAYAEGLGLDQDAAVAYASRARGERRRPSTGWPSLTPTENRVARLAADGLTNQEIGAELLMGAETVKTHLSRIYGKLGIRNRRALPKSVPERMSN